LGPESHFSRVTGINSQGQIVGDFYGPAAFCISNGSMTSLDPSVFFAIDINDSSQILGKRPGGNSAKIIYNGTITTIPLSEDGFSINNHGQVAGQTADYLTGGIPHAYFYSDGITTDLSAILGNRFSAGTDLNDAGQVVGWYETSSGSRHAFMYSNGSVNDLGVLPGYLYGGASGINSLGQIVGSSGLDSLNSYHAMIYEEGALYDLNTLIPANSNWTLTSARRINDLGQIIGQGISPNGVSHAYLLTPVPEPSVGILLVIGILGVWTYRQRHK
jgi:probable HAF family extracellular repeat protein